MIIVVAVFFPSILLLDVGVASMFIVEGLGIVIGIALFFIVLMMFSGASRSSRKRKEEVEYLEQFLEKKRVFYKKKDDLNKSDIQEKVNILYD